jgi:hypothetical protein
MEGVRDQVVAEHHGHLVAAQAVHGEALAAHLRVVEHVVVHERRHVDHLAGGRDHHVPLPDRPEGLPAQEHHRRPEHLATVALDVPAERVHRRHVARELPLEQPADLVEEAREGPGQRAAGLDGGNGHSGMLGALARCHHPRRGRSATM